jgi:ribonuclease J
MLLTIHRGAKEIGGSCVELQSGRSRILIDLGLPLTDAHEGRIDPREMAKKSRDDLLKSGLLPRVEGLYKGDLAGFDAILLSHPHPDHYGLLSFVNPSVPVYMSEGCRQMLHVASYFCQTDYEAENASVLQPGEPVKIGPFTVTPYLVDHSAFGALAFLIESRGKRLFYSGDFRGHGRKHTLFEAFTKHPPGGIDCLLLEGTLLGRDRGDLKTERDVEEKIVELTKGSERLFFVACSSQNIDRLVSVYRACVRSSRTFVIDPYTAFVLDQLKHLSPGLPQHNWGESIRVFFANSRYTKRLADDGALFRFRSAKITYEEMVHSRSRLVVKDSFSVRRKFARGRRLVDSILIYSVWEGYLSGTENFWSQNSVPVVNIHASGHASVRHLQAFADALKPAKIVPIHTLCPDRYRDCFGSTVRILKDGESLWL